MRFNAALVNEFLKWFNGFFHLAVQQGGIEKHIKNFFHHCEFEVNEITVNVPYNTLEDFSEQLKVA